MSIYLSNISSLNPFKRVSKCRQYKIAMDIINIQNILKDFDNTRALETIYNEKFKSEYISKKIKYIKDNKTENTGINRLIKKEEKNIEIAFFLKRIERHNDYKYLRFIVTILVTIIIMIIVKTFYYFLIACLKIQTNFTIGK